MISFMEVTRVLKEVVRQLKEKLEEEDSELGVGIRREREKVVMSQRHYYRSIKKYKDGG